MCHQAKHRTRHAACEQAAGAPVTGGVPSGNQRDKSVHRASVRPSTGDSWCVEPALNQNEGRSMRVCHRVLATAGVLSRHWISMRIAACEPTIGVPATGGVSSRHRRKRGSRFVASEAR